MIVTVRLLLYADGDEVMRSDSTFDSGYFFALYDALDEVRTDIRSELMRLGWDVVVKQAGVVKTNAPAD